MVSRKGPYKLVNSKIVYKNPWIEVKEENVIRPDGKPGIFGTVDYHSGASIIALDQNQNIYLIKEYYYILEREGIQLPSGGKDEGETDLQAAQKELREETGITADNWQVIGRVDPFPMIIKSPATLFLATNLHRSRKIEDEIEVVKMPFGEAFRMVMEGQITHAQSCVAILKLKILLDKDELVV